MMASPLAKRDVASVARMERRTFYPGWTSLRPIRFGGSRPSFAFPRLYIDPETSGYEAGHDPQAYLDEREDEHISPETTKVAALASWQDGDQHYLELVLMWAGTAAVTQTTFDLDQYPMLAAHVHFLSRLGQEFLDLPRRRRIDEDEEGVLWRYADPPPPVVATRTPPPPPPRSLVPTQFRMRIWTFSPGWRSLRPRRFRRPSRAFPGLYVDPAASDAMRAASLVSNTAAVAGYRQGSSLVVETVQMLDGTAFVNQQRFDAGRVQAFQLVVQLWINIARTFANSTRANTLSTSSSKHHSDMATASLTDTGTDENTTIG